MNTFHERFKDLKGSIAIFEGASLEYDFADLPLLKLRLQDVEDATEKLVKELGNAIRAKRLRKIKPAATPTLPVACDHLDDASHDRGACTRARQDEALQDEFKRVRANPRIQRF